MSWPVSQDYNEAIQDPRLCFADAELRAAEPVVNALGLPMPRSGNFADVYELRRGESRWAVKCFTRSVAGLGERYAAVGAHLAAARLPFTVEFVYLEQGIRIRGRWYPALKMQWVEGFLLNQFVRDHLGEPELLGRLSGLWRRLAVRLREARIAHGDLQHGNVLLVPGSRAASLALKLIDYDGMHVPALAGRASGEVGHPAFQHPRRPREGLYGPETDRFPLLVVATALRALAVEGRPLWERFDTGDNLLFRHADFVAPHQSPVFAALSHMSDPLTRQLAGHLARACGEPLDRTPRIEDLLEAEPPPTIDVELVGPTGINVELVGDAVTPGPDGSRRARPRRWLVAAGLAALIAVTFGLAIAVALALTPRRPDAPPTTEVVEEDPPPDQPPPEPPPPEPQPGPRHVRLAEQARAVGDYTAAATHLDAAAALLPPDDAAARAYFEERKREVQRLDRARLKGTVAPVERGLFLGFTKGDWAHGLPLLATGSDKELADLAWRDQAADKGTAEEQAAVADAWWDRAENETEPERMHVRARARLWYLRAFAGLAGPARATARQRLTVAADEGQPRLAGLVCDTFADEEFKERKTSRLVERLDISLPPPTATDARTYRWRGTLVPPLPGPFHLALEGTGRPRLRVAPAEPNRPQTLEVVWHRDDRPGRLKLVWSRPGVFEAAPVPAEALFHTADQETP